MRERSFTNPRSLFSLTPPGSLMSFALATQPNCFSDLLRAAPVQRHGDYSWIGQRYTLMIPSALIYVTVRRRYVARICPRRKLEDESCAE